MPPNRFKSITVSEEAYDQAKKLKKLGLEDSIGMAFANAMKEYRDRREKMIDELQNCSESATEGEK